MHAASGSYEGCLFGWSYEEKGKDDTKKRTFKSTNSTNSTGNLTQNWGFKACNGAIRCIAISSDNKFLVCGSVDEKVHIFDMTTRKSLGELTQHSGAITSIKFYDSTHLISASEDSTLCIWRVSDWECVHILGGHKGPVTDLAIHPSGKLALSISKDYTLKLWNLIHGRSSFTRRLKGQASKIHFNTDGSAYLIIIDNNIHVYQTSDNSLTVEIVHKLRVNQALFQSNESIISIGEDRVLKIYSLIGNEINMDLSTLEGRPRDMWLSSMGLSIITSTGLLTVLSITSLLANASYQESIITSHKVTGEPRLICLTTWDDDDAVNSKAENLDAEESAAGGSKRKKRTRTIEDK